MLGNLTKSVTLYISGCQTVWVQIRTDKMSVLIRIQTVCKCVQPTTKVAASKERVGSVEQGVHQNSNAKSNIV